MPRQCNVSATSIVWNVPVPHGTSQCHMVMSQWDPQSLSDSIYFNHGITKEDKKKESDHVTFTLKVRTGQTGTSAPSYKMKVAKFEDGTPTEWIEVMNALEAIWKQNSLNTASDRQASVKTILREDALTAFEASIHEDLEPEENAAEGATAIQITTEMIDEALISVAKNIFPHRALEIQKIWMKRQVRKPKDMPVRKMIAIITKMNNSLARFPEADENDKFEAKELLEIIEWSLPNEWRAKFDLQGYVPSKYDKKTPHRRG
jgi:hypothetical protein